MKPRPESQLMRAVLQRLSWMRPYVRVLRLNAGLTVVGSGSSRRAIKGVEAGTPDLMVMLGGGRVVWLELKVPKGRVTEAQARWHLEARAAGHTVHVVRTVDDAVDAVLAALEEM